MAVAAGTPGRVGEVKLFNPQTGELVAELTTASDEIFDVEFSRDGSRLRLVLSRLGLGSRLWLGDGRGSRRNCLGGRGR